MDRAQHPVTPVPREAERQEFYPYHITEYQRCPERYFLKFVRNVKMRFVWSRSWAIGIVTHNAIAARANARSAGDEPPTVEAVVDRLLAEQPYAREAPDALVADREFILSAIDWFEGRIPEDAEILSAEREFDTLVRSIHLKSRVDLVIRHPDGEIEHIDFKTGRPRRERVQEVISRITVCATYPESTVRTTVLYAVDHSVTSEIMERREQEPIWRQITQTIDAIRSATSWPPSPSAFCPYCQYASICSAKPLQRPSGASPEPVWDDPAADG